jgi:DNA-binding transcriptional LysR family regulator
MNQLRRILPSANALLAFEAAARLGSFTKAARELGVTQAAVSYSMRQLETALGVSLFARRHRRVELTESGERFYHDVSLGLAHILRSAEDLRRQHGDRHVTLSVSTAFASHWMLPRLADFRQKHTEIDLRLQTTDKDVDLVAEGISLGIRRGEGHWPGCGSARFADEEILPLCSPAFLAAEGPFESLEALARGKLIHLDEPFRPRPGWADWFAALGLPFQDRGEGLRLNDYALVIQAALEGQGVALGWAHLTRDLMRQGLLIPARPERWQGRQGFYVVWPLGQLDNDDCRAVRSWLLEQSAPSRGGGERV